MPEQITEILFISILFFGGIQIAYWLFYLVGILRIGKGRNKDTALQGVSVVVAAKDELHNLRALVPALVIQNYQEFEIIIVNDRSIDGSLEYLLKMEEANECLKALHIHDLPEHITGKKYALTLGIKAAKYKNILLTDADCLPVNENWVASMAYGFNQGADFVLGFSTYTKLPGFLNSFIRYETLLTGIQYLSAAANKLPYMGVGRNLGYKKDIFIENKGFIGFQELIGGDDDLFVNKYAKARLTKVVVGPDSLVQSSPKQSWDTFLKQKHRHMRIGKHYSFGSKLGIGIFNISWILYLLLIIAGVILGLDPVVLGSIALSRLLIMLLSFILGTKKIGITYLGMGVVILDLVYPIYYIFAGIKAFFIKSISWE